VQTEHIVQINRNLTLLQLQEELDISSLVLRELISRWSVGDNCFRIRQHLMPFKLLDVCFVVGLPVVGQQLSLEDDGGGLVNKVFGGDDIKLDILMEKLRNQVYREKNVDEFYRLYILLLLYVFFFPRTSRTFSSFPFKVLDNLYAL